MAYLRVDFHPSARVVAAKLMSSSPRSCAAITRHVAHRLGMAVEFVDGVSWHERERLLNSGYCVLNVFTELDTPSLTLVAPADSTL